MTGAQPSRLRISQAERASEDACAPVRDLFARGFLPRQLIATRYKYSHRTGLFDLNQPGGLIAYNLALSQGSPAYATAQFLCRMWRAPRAERLGCEAGPAALRSVHPPAGNGRGVSADRGGCSDRHRRIRVGALPASSASAADHSAPGKLASFRFAGATWPLIAGKFKS
jgi:hypothetical protein